MVSQKKKVACKALALVLRMQNNLLSLSFTVSLNTKSGVRPSEGVSGRISASAHSGVWKFGKKSVWNSLSFLKMFHSDSELKKLPR